jgi:hypothetical protein
MCGAIPPLPQYVFMAWCLVKHRDNFTFYLTYFGGRVEVECSRFDASWLRGWEVQVEVAEDRIRWRPLLLEMLNILVLLSYSVSY